MARELEQFLGRGNEKAFYIFTYKNAGGAIAGGFVGNRLGETLGGGVLMLALTLVFVGLGLYVTMDTGGLMRIRRWAFLLAYYVRRVATPQERQIIESSALFAVVETRESPIRVRKAGQTVVGKRERSTP